MGTFGNYEMPIWYPSGARNEHLAVITACGIFDTSHMAVLKISGPDANGLLQNCFSRDLNACIKNNSFPLIPGKCIYGLFLNKNGETIDDAVLYQLSKSTYMAVINSGMGERITDHLKKQMGSQNVLITDLTQIIGKIDIQGPLSAKIISKVLQEPEKILADMTYFTFKGAIDDSSDDFETVLLSDNIPVLLSRTGYTGEFGFELFSTTKNLINIWDMLMDTGKSYGLIPCGLAARDSLRAGAGLPLSHQDIGDWPFKNNPWTIALPYNETKTGFTKKFLGDNALLNIEIPEFTYPFVGNDLRKVSISDPAFVYGPEGNSIGRVLTCASDMAIGKHENRIFSTASPDRPTDFTPKGLCCGFVKVTSKLHIGQIVELRDNRRKINVTITDDIRPNRTARYQFSRLANQPANRKNN